MMPKNAPAATSGLLMLTAAAAFLRAPVDDAALLAASRHRTGRLPSRAAGHVPT
jgi:hypothetical protein